MVMPSFLEAIRLYREYAPLLDLGQKFLAAKDAPERAQSIADMVEWLTSKSVNTIDDKYAKHLSAYLHSPLGVDFVTDLVADLQSFQVAAAQAESNEGTV
jgi:hypothetical protein